MGSVRRETDRLSVLENTYEHRSKNLKFILSVSPVDRYDDKKIISDGWSIL